jgi:hypothetical protein
MDKINPFRNPENDSLVDTIRAVLSGKPIEEKKHKMDPVDPEAAKKKFKDRKDKDIDNDGDVDSSDEYLHKRRKAIATKEAVEDNPANYQHLCAKNVVHEKWGTGNCIPTMHADPDAEGNVAWYDVMFEHGIEAKVSIDELKVTKAEEHMHASVDKKKKMKKEMAHGDKKKMKKEMAHGDKKKMKKDEIDLKPSTNNDRSTAE